MNCPEPDKLVAYYNGLLTGASSVQMKRHLEECEACRSELDQLLMLDLDGGPQALSRGSGDVDMSAELWGKIRDAISPSLELRINITPWNRDGADVPVISGDIYMNDRSREGNTLLIEALPLGNGTRGPDPGHDLTNGPGAAASRFEYHGMEGIILVRPGRIKIYMKRGGKPLSQVPVRLRGPLPDQVRYSGKAGEVTYRGLPPGEYLVHIYAGRSLRGTEPG